MERRLRSAFVLIACAAVTSCAQMAQLNRSLINIGKDDVRLEVLEDFTPRLKLQKVWSYSIGETSDARLNRNLLLIGEYLFTCDIEGRAYALLAAQGKPLWTTRLGKKLSFCAGGGRESLLFGTFAGDVIAVSLKDGKVLWQKSFKGGAVTAISRSHRGHVIVRNQNGDIRLLNIKDGKERWAIYQKLPSLSIQGMSVPVFYEEFGLVGLDDGRLIFVSLDQGEVVEELRVGLVQQDKAIGDRIVDIDGTITVFDSVLYASSYQGRTLALDLVLQKVLWFAKISSHRGLGVDKNKVYLANGNNELVGIDRFIGTELWKTSEFSLRNLTAPLSYGEWVVVADDEGNLFWVSSESGDILAREDIGDAIYTSPVVYQDQVIAVTQSGTLASVKVVARYRVAKAG